MLTRKLMPLFILAVAIILFIFLKQTKPEGQTMTKPEKVWRVNSVEVSPGAFSPTMTVYGRVETPVITTLRAAISADVVQIHQFEGQSIDKGQSLITLDNRDVMLLVQQRQADINDIQAQIDTELDTHRRNLSILENQRNLLALSKKAVERVTQLEQTKLTSQATLDDALAAEQRQIVTVRELEHTIAQHTMRLDRLNAQKQRAQAQLELAELDLSRTVIMSPVSGRIANIHVGLGDRVRIGDSLATVYDLANLEVRAQIPSGLSPIITKLLNMNKTIHAYATMGEEELTFTLSRLSGEVANDSGGIDGLFTLMTPSNTLVLGTFFDLTLVLPEQTNVIAIPYDALYGLDSVYVIRDHYLKKVMVQRIGEATINQQRVLLVTSDHLAAGEQIVSTQLPNAMTGLKVEIINE